MNIQEITIALIRQVLRYNQYLAMFRKLGMDTIDFDLDLMGIVFKLMGITDDEITDELLDAYERELSKSDELPLVPLGKNLDLPAQECYRVLSGFKSRDRGNGFPEKQ